MKTNQSTARFLTDDKDLLLRSANETIALLDSTVSDNVKQAVHVLSPFRVAMDNDRIAEVTYMFNNTVIARNGRGIDQLSW